ncbi:uncharacterized protein LOC124370533 [Homalodisca vitripennis]|uniref:uncharacterized protein LOC124370533 n=1 Tax=Homalodisca vitripennis TaxID=197043 RepID=UPI001EEA5182|nr:uncharacterized protein LOC124370533 [Homalodisca vitripennis]
MGDNRKSKVGGKILHSQAREIIFNLYTFMKREAEQGPILLKQVQQRVAEATGISKTSVKRIVSEERTAPRNGPRFSTPRKTWSKKIKKTAVDDFDKTVIRRTVHEFHRIDGQRPTLKTLLPVLKEKIGFRGGIWTLRQVLKELQFKWRKSTDNRKLLIEKHEIREHRVRFIRAIKRYREEGRPIVYTDETYVHASHTKPHSWSDGSNKGLLTPISKGEYGIIVHAGNENGFIDNALLVFKSGQKSGDYHDCMNFKNYKKYLQEKLIPNLPPKTVLVIDNASYHNKQLNPAPTSNSKKAEIIQWLVNHNIPFHDKMLKTELYQIVKLNKNPHKMFEIDSILAEHGHSALRLPPYHPDLNPIEMIWSLIKNHVALKNTTFKLNDCIKLVREKVQDITKEEWAKRCQHVINIEKKYMEHEVSIDDITESFIINLEAGSSDDDSGSDSEHSSHREDSGGEMSGVEVLE